MERIQREPYLIFDPQGRPKVTAGSDHYFYKWCLYIRHSVRPSLLFQVRIVITTSRTVDLAGGHW